MEFDLKLFEWNTGLIDVNESITKVKFSIIYQVTAISMKDLN